MLDRGQRRLVVGGYGLVLLVAAGLLWWAYGPNGQARAGQPPAVARATRTPLPTRTPRPTDIPWPTETPRPTATATHTATATSTATPVPSATPRPPAPEYSVLRDLVANMTEAQWKPYLAGLAGAGVTGWSGWVEDVDQSLGGEYTLLVDMDSPEELFSVFDVRFAVDAETALGLVKDSEVQFLGVIESANNILGSVVVTLRDAELE